MFGAYAIRTEGNCNFSRLGAYDYGIISYLLALLLSKPGLKLKKGQQFMRLSAIQREFDKNFAIVEDEKLTRDKFKRRNGVFLK